MQKLYYALCKKLCSPTLLKKCKNLHCAKIVEPCMYCGAPKSLNDLCQRNCSNSTGFDPSICWNSDICRYCTYNGIWERPMNSVDQSTVCYKKCPAPYKNKHNIKGIVHSVTLWLLGQSTYWLCLGVVFGTTQIWKQIVWLVITKHEKTRRETGCMYIL